MTDFTSIAAHPVQGKHNMASDAFDALKTARAGNGAQKTAELSFGDVLDTLNPLQHIPVVSSIYRELTGDTISPGAKVAGGALYGGPIGLVASVFDAAVEAVTGSDLGEHAIASLTGGKEAEPKAVASAEAVAPQTAGAAATPAQPVKLAEAAPSVPKPMPQLSPDAFNALLNSFADPKTAKAANPALASAAEPAGAKTPAKVAEAPRKPADLSSAITNGLDQLEDLKRAQPDIPLATSFAGTEANGL